MSMKHNKSSSIARRSPIAHILRGSSSRVRKELKLMMIRLWKVISRVRIISKATSPTI